MVVRKQQGPLDVYQLNPQVGLRYFPREMERIMPKPGFQLFAADKSPNTFRIFVLGGSTTAGFPYPVHGSFANLLRIRLEPHLPDHELEVVNCGVTALNSYAVLDFIDELAGYEPDLFVVYAGHNEFYGALGPASRVAFGRSRGWVRTLRWILDLRIARLLGRAIDSVRGDPERVAGQTLMGAMVGQTGILEGDPTWNATIEGYEGNLEGIVRAAGGTPILLCEVVSNLRDQYPFESLHGAELSEESAIAFDRELESARETVDAWWGDPGTLDDDPIALAEVESTLSNLVRTDPEHAGAVFTDARLRLIRWAAEAGEGSLGDEGEASRAPEATRAPDAIRDSFILARDLDTIRFRAPSAINQIVREVVTRSGPSGAGKTTLVPTGDWIGSASDYGVPGFDMFVEHLHLTLPGADALARVLVRTIAAEGVFGSSWVAGPEMATEVALERTGLTPLDSEIAERRTFQLTHRWPYPEDRKAVFRSRRPSVVQDLARSFVEHEIDLAEAHFRLGESWFREGKRSEALRELHTACELFPVVPQRFLLAGRLALEEGQPRLAADLLARGAALDPEDSDLARWRDRALEAARSLPAED